MSDNYTESPEGQAELEQLERDERERQEADAALVAPREPLPDQDNHHNALLCPYCNPKGLTFADPESAALVAGLRQEVEILRVTVRGDQQVEKALDAEVAGLRQELQKHREERQQWASDIARREIELTAGLRGLITQWRADEVDAANHCAIADQDTYDGWDTKRRLCDQHGTALEARLDPGRPARSLEET